MGYQPVQGRDTLGHGLYAARQQRAARQRVRAAAGVAQDRELPDAERVGHRRRVGGTEALSRPGLAVELMYPGRS
jgi:hypothetical protein